MSGHLYAQFGEKEKHASRLITYIPEPKYQAVCEKIFRETFLSVLSEAVIGIVEGYNGLYYLKKKNRWKDNRIW